MSRVPPHIEDELWWVVWLLPALAVANVVIRPKPRGYINRQRAGLETRVKEHPHDE